MLARRFRIRLQECGKLASNRRGGAADITVAQGRASTICPCTSACNDRGRDSWCFVNQDCAGQHYVEKKYTGFYFRGYGRYCDPRNPNPRAAPAPAPPPTVPTPWQPPPQPPPQTPPQVTQPSPPSPIVFAPQPPQPLQPLQPPQSPPDTAQPQAVPGPMPPQLAWNQPMPSPEVSQPIPPITLDATQLQPQQQLPHRQPPTPSQPMPLPMPLPMPPGMVAETTQVQQPNPLPQQPTPYIEHLASPRADFGPPATQSPPPLQPMVQSPPQVSPSPIIQSQPQSGMDVQPRPVGPAVSPAPMPIQAPFRFKAPSLEELQLYMGALNQTPININGGPPIPPIAQFPQHQQQPSPGWMNGALGSMPNSSTMTKPTMANLNYGQAHQMATYPYSYPDPYSYPYSYAYPQTGYFGQPSYGRLNGNFGGAGYVPYGGYF